MLRFEKKPKLQSAVVTLKPDTLLLSAWRSWEVTRTLAKSMQGNLSIIVENNEALSVCKSIFRRFEQYLLHHQ